MYEKKRKIKERRQSNAANYTILYRSRARQKSLIAINVSTYAQAERQEVVSLVTFLSAFDAAIITQKIKSLICFPRNEAFKLLQ